jgi:hypothetical protein
MNLFRVLVTQDVTPTELLDVQSSQWSKVIHLPEQLFRHLV